MAEKNKAAVELGRLGGSKKSPAKTAACRANAKKPRGKREPLRIRLTKTHSISEIDKMISDLEKDPASKVGAKGMNIFNDAVCRKLDEMSWAVYTLRKNENSITKA